MSPRTAALSLAAILAFSLEAEAQTPKGAGPSSGAAEVEDTSPSLPPVRGVPRPESDPKTYGTTSQITHTIQAFGFVPFTSGGEYGATGNGAIYCAAGAPCFMEAPLFLPAGALVSAIEAEVCDSDAVNDVHVSLFRTQAPGGSSAGLATFSTAGTLGCHFPFAPLAVPEAINNFGRSYFVQVRLDAATSANRFNAVRVIYTLQVSPAPAVATFSDVPTGHPYFRFVEALVEAGITAGCGGGLYCVNAPITRGEMAVFLSAALGLHFAP